MQTARQMHVVCGEMLAAGGEEPSPARSGARGGSQHGEGVSLGLSVYRRDLVRAPRAHGRDAVGAGSSRSQLGLPQRPALRGVRGGFGRALESLCC